MGKIEGVLCGLSLTWATVREKEKGVIIMDIQQLRKACTSGVPIEYKAHCLKRMSERDISRKNIIDCIMNGEIIEDYPLDDNNVSEASFPACLILWVDIQEDGALHVVVGYNGRKIIIISAYRPDIEHWETDYKTRRKENNDVQRLF